MWLIVLHLFSLLFIWIVIFSFDLFLLEIIIFFLVAILASTGFKDTILTIKPKDIHKLMFSYQYKA